MEEGTGSPVDPDHAFRKRLGYRFEETLYIRRDSSCRVLEFAADGSCRYHLWRGRSGRLGHDTRPTAEAQECPSLVASGVVYARSETNRQSRQVRQLGGVLAIAPAT